MLSVTSATRVLVATTPVELRGSFNRLYGLVVERLKGDPLSGQLFVFTNRRRNRIKVLYWDSDGLWGCAKRLEGGRFTWPGSEKWTALNQFITDGMLEIDNNLIENSIRPRAVGKRIGPFVGHPKAGERSAVIYTLLGDCRRHGVNAFDYLKDMFTRPPAAKINQIKEFTPAA